MPDDLAGVRVLLFQQRGWGLRIGHELARRLHQAGATLAALTFKDSTHQFVVDQTEVPYVLVENHDHLMEDPDTWLGDRSIGLDEVCKGLGVDSVWPLMQSMRKHIRSYGEKYYYSFRQKVNDKELRSLIIADYVMANDILDKFEPDVIIAPNFVAMPHIIMEFAARQRGINMTVVTDSKIPGIAISSWSHTDNAGPFFEHFATHKDEPVGEKARQVILNLQAGLKDHMGTRITAPKPLPLRGLIRSIGSAMLRPPKLGHLGVATDARTVKTVLRDFVRHNQFLRSTLRQNYDGWPEEPFAFFPLQFQPEATMDVISPRLNNQLEVIRQVAMSMPDDMSLVVKEHPAMIGRRSPTYLEKIARTPNVQLIHPLTSTADILERAACIITIGGTILAEAAWVGVPALQLGPLGTTQLFPNVTHHDDLRTLAPAIRRVAAKGRFEGKSYNSELARYAQSVLEVGLEENYWGLWERGEEVDFEVIWTWYRKEIQAALRASPARPTLTA